MPRHFKPRLLVGRYRSKSEERVAGHLNDLGVAYLYEPKELKVSYKVERKASYLPDFVLTGTGVILEVKGYLTSADRAKYIRIKESNPDIDIRFVFDRASNKLNKTSKTTYSEWAEKHGFLWCEKIIPPTWYKESKHARTSSKAAGTPRTPSSRKVLHLTHGSTHRPRHLSTRCKYP
jgi:hypothetical protein